MYTPHNFAGVAQRYDRVANLLTHPALWSGRVGAAAAFCIDGPALLAAPRRDPSFFVEPEVVKGA